MESLCFHLTTIIHTHTHTDTRNLAHTHTSQMTLALVLNFFNSIFKSQHLDIFCLFKCTGSSQVSIYTHTHTHIYTNSMSITMALTWFRVTTGKHLRFLFFFFFFCFQLQSSSISDLLVLFSHIILRIIATLLYIYLLIFIWPLTKRKGEKKRLIQ